MAIIIDELAIIYSLWSNYFNEMLTVGLLGRKGDGSQYG